jgi:hypothetical protein
VKRLVSIEMAFLFESVNSKATKENVEFWNNEYLKGTFLIRFENINPALVKQNQICPDILRAVKMPYKQDIM